jgi:hypothetical protein
MNEKQKELILATDFDTRFLFAVAIRHAMSTGRDYGHVQNGTMGNAYGPHCVKAWDNLENFEAELYKP